MQGKNIKQHFRLKINDWLCNIDDENVRNAIRDNAIITGGAIVSLLQDEKPHDYDVYFANENALKIVADYYVKRFVALAKDKDVRARTPEAQRCYWSEESKRWVVLKGDEHKPDERVRIFIRSDGATGMDFKPHGETDADYRHAMAKIGGAIKNNENSKIEDLPPYSPIFMTNNAITLKNGIQIVLRFYGSPEDIHKNYDFVHCTSYWTSKDNKLVLPARALEAIINKELYYVGSKYPLCSIIRTRKFLKRGWNINAGQYVKMVLQLNELDLKNLHVFEEQLIGVDSAYFGAVINHIDDLQKNKEKIDTDYLIKLINEVFDEGGEIHESSFATEG